MMKTENNSGSENNSESESESENISESESESKNNSESESESKNNPESESKNNPESESKNNPESELKNNPESELKKLSVKKLLKLVKTYIKNGENDKVLEIYRMAILKGSFTAAFDLAFFYSTVLHNKKVAIEFYFLAAVGGESLGIINYNIAMCYSHLTHIEKKIKYLEISTSFDFIDSFIELSYHYIEKKEYDIAETYLRSVYEKEKELSLLPFISLYLEKKDQENARKYILEVYTILQERNKKDQTGIKLEKHNIKIDKFKKYLDKYFREYFDTALFWQTRDYADEYHNYILNRTINGYFILKEFDKEITETVNKIKDSKEKCCVCLDEKIMLPTCCAHFICAECSHKISVCPLCRKNIK